MLEVKNLTKIYYGGRNTVRALNNVNINFGSSGLVVILGKSGCGKSTLLNMIGGLDLPTSGEVIINGQSTKNFKRSDYDAYRNTFVGIVFQEFNLIDEISVFDNINMTMKLQEKNADVNTVDEALSMVGLGNLGYRKPSELSGGQRQRVALARALLKKPEIILADEPTGALDSVTSEEVFETLKRIAQNKLVIIVTHNRDLAFSYADRIIEIVDGSVVSDKTRAGADDEGIKELPCKVIEVGAGGKVTAEQLNERLENGSVNYIGLVHEKDKVALAYPETVDSFYAASTAAAFSETEQKDIKTDEKPFKLSKGGFKIKDALILARQGIKRTKKRYRFLTFITSMCFTFFALALIMGSVNLPALAAKTAYESGAQPLVAVGKANTRGGYHGKLTDEDIEAIKDIMGGECAASVDFSATPDFAESYSAYEYDDYYYTTDTGFDRTKFSGSLEVSDISDIGLKLIDGGGKSSCSSLDEIIISDHAAHVFTVKGFIGYDAEGKYGIHYPLEERDLVGCRIGFAGTDKFYTVVGVFDTNYEEYSSIVGASALNRDKSDLTMAFGANKSFLYSKLVTAKGFGSSISKLDQSSSAQMSMSFDRGDGTGLYYDLNAVSLIYDKMRFDGQMVWSESKDEDGNYLAPEALKENEIIISYDVARNLAEEYSGMPIETFVQSEKFKSAVARPYSVELRYKYNTVGQFDSLRIVGVGLDYSAPITFDEKQISGILESVNDGYDVLYFHRGISQGALSSKFKKLNKYYEEESDPVFLFGTATANMDEIGYFDSMFEMLGFVFLIIALVMLILAFLITFNYMTASIRFRTKEIAVYRVIGAKTIDVAKTFLAEGGFIVLITTIVATVLSFLLSTFINNILGASLYLIGISFTLVNFNWFIEPLVILLGSAATVLLSSLVPIMRVCGKRPAEAVKMI